MVYYLLLLAMGCQRLGELRLGRQNLERVRARLFSPVNTTEKRRMLLLHAAWFASCALEFFLRGRLVGPRWFLVGGIVLMVCQAVRFHSMNLLGESWIHLPVAYRGQKLSRAGLYRFTKHPNYWAVVVEILLVPLLGGAYFTALLFSVTNAAFLWRRIQIEESQLTKIGSTQ